MRQSLEGRQSELRTMTYSTLFWHIWTDVRRLSLARCIRPPGLFAALLATSGGSTDSKRIGPLLTLCRPSGAFGPDRVPGAGGPCLIMPPLPGLY